MFYFIVLMEGWYSEGTYFQEFCFCHRSEKLSLCQNMSFSLLSDQTFSGGRLWLDFHISSPCIAYQDGFLGSAVGSILEVNIVLHLLTRGLLAQVYHLSDKNCSSNVLTVHRTHLWPADDCSMPDGLQLVHEPL